MGQPDLYPFALTPATIEKLRFIHELVHGRRGLTRQPARYARAGAALAGEPERRRPAARTSATGSDITRAPTGFQAKGTPLALQARRRGWA